MAAASGELAFRTGLVGRAAEVGKLRFALDSALAGRGRVVFLAGEAGIGKSRLLEELAHYAAAKGFRTMSGTCFPESLTPYAAFLEAFQKGGLDYLFLEEPLRIESLFAIDKAGLVLAKAERAESPLDPDIFTSMLRVVEEFLKDAVRTAGGTAKGGLNVLGLGEYRIFLQAGPHVTAVAVLRGRENEFLIEDLKDIVARIEDKYGAVLATWTGTLEELEGMDAFLKPVLASKKYDGVDYARGDPLLRRNRLFENVSLGLVREARQMPVLLTLDDLQWADPSSISLVHYIARAIHDAPILLVGAYRAEELAMGLRGAKHPLEDAMQLMSREGLHEDVRLARLNDAQTTELVEALLGNVDLAEENEREVFRASGGNPFFLIELARLVIQEGLLVRDGNVWRFSKTLRDVEIPTRVYNVVLRRLQRITSEQRDVIDFAAILGEEFPADVLASCLGKERIAVLKVLRDLETTHQLVRSRQARYRFDHAQVRDVLLREMPDGIRMEYHRIGGEALERIHGPALATNYRALAEVAYHFYEARDAAKAIPYNLQAGAAARQAYANAEATAFYTHALELMDASTPADERSGALETRADLLELVGRYEEAIEDYRLLLDVAGLRPDLAARIHRKLGAIHQRQGKFAEADTELRQALDLLGGRQVAEAGQVHLWLGRTASGRADYDAAMGAYRHAYEILAHAPDRDELDLAEAQYSSGMVHYWIALRNPPRAAAEIEAARADFTACVEARRRQGDELGMRPALNMLANTFAYVDAYDSAIPYYEESLHIGERVGDLYGITKPLINLGRIYRFQGEGEKALTTFNRALNILLKVGDQRGLASVYREAAEVYRDRGEWANAIDYYHRCFDIAGRIGEKLERAGALLGLGGAYLEQGDPNQAVDALTRALDAFEAVHAWQPACESAADLVRCHLLLGDLGAARAASERAAAAAGEAKVRRLDGLTATMEASVLRMAGDLAGAEAKLATARAAFEGGATDLDVANLEYEQGLLLRKLGRTDEAADSLRKAESRARRAGRLGLAQLAGGALTS